ncbi:tenascin-X isoform X1 [Mixophyes fleayi]|uniref:tenascin-X isoform X1 n=1 Tax=Mixophyes fleayi TaxID=3061075 RepID=UPI003F4DF993
MTPISLSLVIIFFGGSLSAPTASTQPQCPDADGVRALLKRLVILEKLVRDIKGQCTTPCCGKVQSDAENTACSQEDNDCPGGCGGDARGSCVDGQCQCKDGYMGDRCQLLTCPEDCNDQGRCVKGRCVCFKGFFGVTCGSKACTNNCQNHGRCEDGVCVCDPGFSGEDCSSRTCPKNCLNQGKCEGGVCVCPSGFTGQDCGTKTCPRNCLHVGVCENGVCVCPPGFSGVDCGSRGCPNNCKDRGDCEDGVCVCDTGFTGVDCGTRTCLNDCNKNGKCEDGVCVCDVGFYGEDCVYKACPEECNEQGRCILGKCVCDPGFVGVDCGTRICSPECERRGRCEDGECICDPGFTGPDCEIRTCPNDCYKQGRCDDGKCICDSGYTGLDCKSRTCPNKCHNRGRCEDGICICNAGFSGSDCGAKACPKNCSGNGQCVNGKCICNVGFSGPVCGIRTCPAGCTKHGRCMRGTCVCSPGYTGEDCGVRTCPKNCHNRGRCEGGVCFCDLGFTGLDCGTKTCPNDCYDRGHCEDGACVCDYGFTGQDCGTRTCSNDCHNRGRCEDGVCICDSGYTGQDCGTRTCPRDCHNRGQCEDGVCACESGYTGLDCGARTCPKDCNNRGRCEDGQCVCASGYTGVDCGTRTCPENCNDNGSCDDGKCVCYPGYTGLDCGSKTCPNDCNNRGQCEDGLCQCDPGYTDIDCGLRTCPNDCQNRGQCDDGVCVCNAGYSGQDCSSRTCQENCNDRGRCDDGKCVCDPGFTGLDCGTRSCPDNCHIHGKCQEGVCVCNTGYTGPDCGSKACPKNCNNNGQCMNGKCVCNTGFAGPVCGAKVCPNNCSGQGKCTNGICVCKKGYSGPDCAGEVTELLVVTGLRVTLQEDFAVTLEWDQTQTAPESYDISFKVKKENGVISSTIDGSLTTYRQTGLAPGEEYLVTIQPRKGSTLGPESSITTTTKIETPRGFRVTEVSSSSLLLRWERPLTLPDRYIVTLIHPSGKERKLRVIGKGDRIRVTGLEEGTEYRVLLRAEKGEEQSQDTETTGITAGEERKRQTVEEKRVDHGSVGTSQTVETSGNLESSIQETRFRPTLPKKDLSHGGEDKSLTREIKEIITENPKGSSVVYTTKNITTIITTIYKTHHRKDGSVVDVYHETEDSEYPSEKSTHSQDQFGVGSGRVEGDLENVRPFDRRDNLPSIKVERWMFTKNITHVEPSTKESTIHLHEQEKEVTIHPKRVHQTTNIHSKVKVPGSGRLPDSSSVAKKLLEFESSKMKSVTKSGSHGEQSMIHPEGAPQDEHIHDKSPLSGRENRLDVPKTEMTPETSVESSSETGESEVKNEGNIKDDLDDAARTRMHTTTLVKVNRIVTTSRRKVVGREEDKGFHNVTTVVQGRDGVTESAARTKNQTRTWGPLMKTVIENLPEKLSIYNGTFIQRLESYLRATSYPLKVNQTVESVAQAIFLYLVKWKPQSFTGMVYDRLPQKTPGATGNTEPVGSSRLQGSIGSPISDNQVQSLGNTTDSIHKIQGGSVLVRRPDSIAPNVKIVEEIDTPVTLTVDKYISTSEVTDENLDDIDKARLSKDQIKRVIEVDSSKTMPSKPAVDKSKLPAKNLPPPKKTTLPKSKKEQKQDERVEKSDMEVEVEKVSPGSFDKEYEISSKTGILERPTTQPREKTLTSSITQIGTLNVDHIPGVSKEEKREHSTVETPLHHKVKPGIKTETIVKKEMEEGSVIPKKQPTQPRKKVPLKPSTKQEVHGKERIHKETVDGNSPNREIFTEDTEPVIHKSEEKSLVINKILGSGEEQDQTDPQRSPILLKVPSPGAQGRPSIQQKSPTSLVVSLEGLGFLWDKVKIIYSPWPPTAVASPNQMEVDRGVRQVEIRDLAPGTSYRIDLHGMLRGRSSKSYSLVADTALLPTTAPPTQKQVEVTTHPTPPVDVTTGKTPVTRRPSVATPPLGGLQVREVTSDSITLVWKAKTGVFESFLIRYEDVTDSRGTQEISVPSDQREVTLQNLSQNTRYSVSLYGIRGGKLSRPLTEEVTTDSSPDRGTPPRLSPLSVSEVRPDSFRLSWEPLDGDFDAYLLQYGPPGGPIQEETLRGDQTSFLIPGLVAEVNYTVELRGIWGESYSEPEFIHVFTEKPQPPRLESLSLSDIRKDSVHLSWEVTGGGFESFLLYYRDAEGRPQEITLKEDLRSFDVKNLRPGKKYKFVLYGITSGKRSKPVTAETTTEKYLPPHLQSLSVSDVQSESLRLSWIVDGGEFDSFLLLYRDAEGKPVEISLDGEQRSLAVEDLKPGKKYKFILYGISGGKKSKAVIAETSTVTKKEPPSSAPHLVELVASDVTKESVKLSWTVEGKIPFDWIIVQYREPEGGVRELQIAGEDTSTIVHGLLPSRKYEFNVYGLSGEKRSKPLSTEIKTDFLEAVGPPVLNDLYITSQGPHAIQLSWDVQEGTFDSFIVRYGIQDKDGSLKTVTADGAERTLLLSGLQPDTFYTVTLHGVREGKEHGGLEDTGKTAPLDLESPKNLKFSNVEETSAIVSWEPPNPGSTTFKVSHQLADGGEPESISVVGTSTPLKGLIPGTQYEVTVVSVRGFEESQPLTDFFTTAGGGPRSLRAHEVTEVSALLRWEPSTGPVDRYLVTYRAENIPLVTLQVPGDRTELPLSGLHPHTEYFVSVQSSQGSTTSTPTSTSFTTSADTPRNLAASQITARSALLTWKAPDAVPDGYLVTYQTPEGETKEIRLLPSLSSFTLSQLDPTTQYRVQLHALRNGVSSAPISTSFTTGRIKFPYPRDCSEQRMNGEVRNGTFTIYPRGDKEETLTVYCDMESDGGGWIVFQRRMDGSTDFYREWEDYKRGFGNLTSEFWLGNTALHLISSSSPHELRVDLRAGDEAAYAVYDDFRVEAEDRQFRLRLGQYRGNAGDSMSYHNNMIFSTRDRDTQKRILPCAMSYRGAWWYKNCHYANLNGLYANNKDHQGINWYTWKGFEFSIPFTEMKMRPRRVGNQRRL